MILDDIAEEISYQYRKTMEKVDNYLDTVVGPYLERVVAPRIERYLEAVIVPPIQKLVDIQHDMERRADKINSIATSVSNFIENGEYATFMTNTLLIGAISEMEARLLEAAEKNDWNISDEHYTLITMGDSVIARATLDPSELDADIVTVKQDGVETRIQLSKLLGE